MKDFGKINIPVLSVDKCVETLSQIYISAYISGSPFKRVPSVMLWGAPGVGKSQAIRQLGKEIEANTGKKVIVSDVRLLLFNPIDNLDNKK
jgi:predicted AAA+ superfamily ATPase